MIPRPLYYSVLWYFSFISCKNKHKLVLPGGCMKIATVQVCKLLLFLVCSPPAALLYLNLYPLIFTLQLLSVKNKKRIFTIVVLSWS